MKSRYLRMLEAERDSAQSRDHIAFIDTKIASYYARKGMLAEAESIILNIRSIDYKAGYTGLVARINYVEGIIYHCTGLDREAEIKWKRASAMASVDSSFGLLAEIAAWNSFLKYSSGQFELLFSELADCAKYCLESSTQFELPARAAMVIALVLHTCGMTQDALSWYDRARKASLSVGDDVELAALIHNMAWIRLYNYRNALLRGEDPPPSESDLLRVSAEAVQSYESLVGLASFPAFTPLLHAQNHMIRQEFDAALDILNEHAIDLQNQGLSRLTPNFNADRAYCLAKLGRVEEANLASESVVAAIGPNIHPDDLAVLYCRLRDTSAIAGKELLSADYAKCAQDHWRAFDQLIERMLAGIDALVRSGLPSGDSVRQPYRP